MKEPSNVKGIYYPVNQEMFLKTLSILDMFNELKSRLDTKFVAVEVDTSDDNGYLRYIRKEKAE